MKKVFLMTFALLAFVFLSGCIGNMKGTYGVIDLETKDIYVQQGFEGKAQICGSCKVSITKNKWGQILDLQDTRTWMDTAYDTYQENTPKLEDSLIDLSVGNCQLMWIGNNAEGIYLLKNRLEEIQKQ